MRATRKHERSEPRKRARKRLRRLKIYKNQYKNNEAHYNLLHGIFEGQKWRTWNATMMQILRIIRNHYAALKHALCAICIMRIRVGAHPRYSGVVHPFRTGRAFGEIHIRVKYSVGIQFSITANVKL